MKLILENIGGHLFCYFETNKHYKTVQKNRTTKRLANPKAILDEQCDLSYSLPKDTHMVFNVKKVKGDNA